MPHSSRPLLDRLVGKRIRNRRNFLKCKQEALAKRVGVSRTTIVNIELGKQKLAIGQLYDIARELKIQPFKLLPPESELEKLSGQTDIWETIRKKLAKEEFNWVRKIVDDKLKEDKSDE